METKTCWSRGFPLSVSIIHGTGALPPKGRVFVLCFRGMDMDDPTVIKPLMTQLAQQNVTVATIGKRRQVIDSDHIIHSSYPLRNDFDILQDDAESLLYFMLGEPDINHTQCIVIGLRYGGLIAIQLCHKCSQYISNLLLVSTPLDLTHDQFHTPIKQIPHRERTRRARGELYPLSSDPIYKPSLKGYEPLSVLREIRTMGRICIRGLFLVQYAPIRVIVNKGTFPFDHIVTIADTSYHDLLDPNSVLYTHVLDNIVSVVEKRFTSKL